MNVIVPGMTFFTTAFTTALCAILAGHVDVIVPGMTSFASKVFIIKRTVAQRAVVKAVVKKVMPGTITVTCPAKICQHFSFVILLLFFIIFNTVHCLFYYC